MGIKDLWKFGIPDVKSKPPVPFETAKGTKIAIDISTILYPLCKVSKSTLLMTCIPPYPPTDIIDTLAQYHKSIIENKITPCYVLEGYKHPMKYYTHQECLKIRTDAMEKLNNFYEIGKDAMKELTDEDYCNSMKYIKLVASPNNEVLSLIIEWIISSNIWYFGSPFKAKWQCIYLEKIGIVDAIMSTDSDYIMHGVQKLYFNINFNKLTFQVFDRKVDCLNVDDNPLFAYDYEKWPIISALLGCDYIK